MLSILLLAIMFGCKQRQVSIAENEFYVCSMDPQVMEKQPGPCPICKMPLTKAVIDKTQMHQIKLSDEQVKLANIRVDSVHVSGIGNKTTLTGVFAINQNKTEVVSARIKGRIEHLYYKIPGAQVSKGDKLYDLYSRELLEAQEEYLLAKEKGKVLGADMKPIIASARNRLQLWGLSEGQIDALERTRDAKITNTIYSKASGVVTDIPLREGDYVDEGTVVYRIADLSTLWVEAQVYANELERVQEGAVVDITPEPYPAAHISGKIVFANPELQEDSKINLVRIEVNNAGGKYKPGMQAYVNLGGQAKKAFVLPLAAVIQNSGNAIVWLQTKPNTYEPRQVMTGLQSGNDIEIVSGLNPGELVVVRGTYLLNSEFVFKRGANPNEAIHGNMKM